MERVEALAKSRRVSPQFLRRLSSCVRFVSFQFMTILRTYSNIVLWNRQTQKKREKRDGEERRKKIEVASSSFRAKIKT